MWQQSRAEGSGRLIPWLQHETHARHQHTWEDFLGPKAAGIGSSCCSTHAADFILAKSPRGLPLERGGGLQRCRETSAKERLCGDTRWGRQILHVALCSNPSIISLECMWRDIAHQSQYSTLREVRKGQQGALRTRVRASARRAPANDRREAAASGNSAEESRVAAPLGECSETVLRQASARRSKRPQRGPPASRDTWAFEWCGGGVGGNKGEAMG